MAAPIILASGSEARRALLAAAGILFTVRPVNIDEQAVRDAGGDALALAEIKALRVRDDEALVIGADQMLVCDGDWFNKPTDVAEARAQLLRLRGKVHRLETAVVCARGGIVVWHHVATAELTMRPFSEAFLDAYLALEGDAVLASVGAYRLEGLGVQLFDRIDGAHSVILGLPLLPLLGFLRQHGLLLT